MVVMGPERAPGDRVPASSVALAPGQRRQPGRSRSASSTARWNVRYANTIRRRSPSAIRAWTASARSPRTSPPEGPTEVAPTSTSPWRSADELDDAVVRCLVDQASRRRRQGRDAHGDIDSALSRRLLGHADRATSWSLKVTRGMACSSKRLRLSRPASSGVPPTSSRSSTTASVSPGTSTHPCAASTAASTSRPKTTRTSGSRCRRPRRRGSAHRRKLGRRPRCGSDADGGSPNTSVGLYQSAAHDPGRGPLTGIPSTRC